jgi:hypothetical protein
MKVTTSAALSLAAHLFELEIESINNDPEFHFHFNGWLDKFGELSPNHQEQLTSSSENEFNAQAIQKIADEIQQGYKSGLWLEVKLEDGLYNYMMPAQYGGYITQALEMQLAMLTGVGIQQEIDF